LTLPVKAVGHPSNIDFGPDDVVILTMKSQDTETALDDLRLVAGDQVPIVCCQNGVENERVALRRFANVYGMLVIMPANYLEPGLVDTTAWPLTGVLDLGRYPEGTDELCAQIAADLEKSGFIARADSKVMRLKYAKLLQNMVNAIQAVCDPKEDSGDILAKMRAEAEACFAAAGIDCASAQEFAERNARTRVNAGGAGGWRGGSTWQSLMRGVGSSESDYLNGEIVLLGRLHGVPTPANEILQPYVDRLAKLKQPPGSISVEELRSAIARRKQTVSARR
jgi:2-dehydropantoate 2-reductase